MQLRGIHHVNIAVPDIDGARAFYCDVLGCTELPRPDFGVPGLWVDAGGQQIHFLVSTEGPRGGDHFALRVADLDAAVAELAVAGVSAHRSAYIVGAGRQAFLTDPWGNLIELNQPD